jgi:hypothetical protein
LPKRSVSVCLTGLKMRAMPKSMVDVTPCVHHHVIGSDIAEDDRRRLGMQVFQRGAQLAHPGQCLRLALRPLALDALLQRLALEVLHDEIAVPVVAEEVVDAGQRRVAQAG